MANPTYENTKVHWLPSVANIAAPTSAEITAGTDLTAFVPVDGVERGGDQNKASQAMLGDSFVEESVGTYSRTLTITFVRDDVLANDDAWTLFDYRTAGFILLAPFGAPATAARVEVWPVESHKPMMQATAENTKQKFQVNFAVTSAPNEKAVVAA